MDLRPPTIERVWDESDTKWKHVIEPDVVYKFVNGVNDFGAIRFDEDETLTDTNELEYGVTQRLYRRIGFGRCGRARHLASVAEIFLRSYIRRRARARTAQCVSDARRAHAICICGCSAANFSPIVSDLRINPGKRFDTQLLINYDPQAQPTDGHRHAAEAEAIQGVVHHAGAFFDAESPTPASKIRRASTFGQHSNQVRALAGYGDLNRPGWNVTFGASYDFTLGAFQNQMAQISYNGSCCGIGFEYRRFSFGTIRNENQYRIVFRIANLGSVGNLRRQEKIF